MNNKLFAFFETVWSYIDTGKFYREPFRWLYAVIAVLNLLFPLYIIFLTIDTGLFKYMSGGDISHCCFWKINCRTLQSIGCYR